MRGIAIKILLFAVIDILYIQLCPPFPPVVKPDFYAFWRVVFYINWYGLVVFLSQDNFKKTKVKLDQIALKSLITYCVAKLLFYMLLINKDLPTYIKALNSKEVDLFFTIMLWFLAVIIWYNKFNVKKVRRYARWF